jgi:hypothetical protein
MLVAGEQPDAIAVADDDEAEAVVFGLVKPLLTCRHLGAARRDGGLDSWRECRSLPRLES